jgi:ABC-type transport system involved in multi-copper enzyme maturation permease subunit
MMAPSLFVLVIGVYLLLTVMIIMYFCTGIEHGADPVERKYQTAVAIPVALLVFTVATMVGPAT